MGEYVGEVIDNEQKQRRVDRIRALESNEAQFYIMDMDNSRSIDAHYFGNEMRYVVFKFISFNVKIPLNFAESFL